MGNKNEEETVDTQDTTEETIDPESICYMREMMEDWQNINFVQSLKVTDEKVTEVNKTKRGEALDANQNQQQTYWLVDTGSPRSFMNMHTALNLLLNATTKLKLNRRI